MTRVLVVEDSATQAEELRLVLEEHGFSVEVARDGEQGLRALKQRRADVVLSDVVMPRLGGQGLCRAIKSDAELARIPVVLMTSADDPAEVVAAIEAGADGFFRKPVGEVRLVERIQALLANAIADAIDVESRVTLQLFDRSVTVEGDRRQALRLLSSVLEEFVMVNRDLAAERERLQTILESVGDGILVTDEHGQLVLANRAAERLLGPAQASGAADGWSTSSDLYGVDGTARITRSEHPLARALRGEDTDEVDMLVRGTHVTGDIYVSGTGRPIRDARSVVRGGVVVFRDVTSRHNARTVLARKAEELARANEELERTQKRAEQENEHKSRFLAGMSHELRTPLNAIIGFSELLEQGIGGSLTDRQRKYVSNVHQSGRHLLNLVNDILDLSKIEAGRMDLNREWSSPAAIVEAVRGVIQPLADKQGVSLIVDVPDDLPDAYVDGMRTKQILYNLLSNAIKFTSFGGAVTLCGRGIGRELQISVTDTGVGIAYENLKRLFKEFEQIEPASGDKPEGTGLGLALTRRLVEMHGGRIGVRSELGQGSTFTVTFPLLGQGQSLAPPSADFIPAGSIVLVVDDDPIAAELIAGNLRTAGLSVRFARNAEEALAAAKEQHPAAITLDVQMPGGDGWMVLDALKKSPATAHIPVVMISVVDDVTQGFSLGAVECLVKPIAPSALIGALESAGVAVQRVHGLRVLLLTDKQQTGDQIEEHLRRAGCDVVRAEDPSGAARFGELSIDLALVDLEDPMLTAQVGSNLAQAKPGTPVLGLVDAVVRWVKAPIAGVRAVARGDAMKLDRLIRVVREAADLRPSAPLRHATTGLPSPESLMAHLRSAQERATRDSKRISIASARVVLPNEPPSVPWNRLLTSVLRSTEFVAVAGEDLLALVLYGPERPDERVGERLSEVVRSLCGRDPLDVRVQTVGLRQTPQEILSQLVSNRK